MKEALFCASLALAGYGWLTALGTRLPRSFLGFALWPVGCLSWVITAVAALLLGASAEIVMLTHLLATATALVLGLRKGTRSARVFGLEAAAITGMVGLFSLAMQQLGATQGSFDSFELLSLGHSFFTYGFRADVTPLLASWGVLIPVVHGAAVIVGGDILSSLQPLFSISLLGMFTTGIFIIAGNISDRIPKVQAALIAGGAALLLATTNAYVFQSVYIHNNLPSAAFLLLYFVGVAGARRSKDEATLWLAFAGLLGFTLCRLEAPIFAGIAIVTGVYLIHDTLLAKRFGRILIAYTAVVVAWYILLFNSIASGSDILTPSRAALQMGLLITVTLAAAAALRWEMTRWLRLIPALLAGGAFVLAGAALFWSREHFLKNLWIVLKNMTLTGRWEAAWGTLAVCVLWALSSPSSRIRNAFLSFAIAFFTLILAIGLFREPYRLGWGDSGNRMITHVLPLLLMGVVAHLTALLGARETTVKRPMNTGGVMVTVFLGCFFLSLPLSVAWIFPTNVAPQALVYGSGGFCHPNEKGEYGFKVALQSGDHEDYAAACGTGERHMLLKFPRASSLNWITLEEFSSAERWTDFGLFVSNDKENWTPVYDTRMPELASRLARVSPVRFRIAAPPNERPRYLRIDYRSSEGNNQLYLKRLEAYSDR